MVLEHACTDAVQVADTRRQQPDLTNQLQYKCTWSIAIQQRVVRVVACCDASHMGAMGAGVHDYGQHIAVIIDVEGKVAAVHRAECGKPAGVIEPLCLPLCCRETESVLAAWHAACVQGSWVSTQPAPEQGRVNELGRHFET